MPMASQARILSLLEALGFELFANELLHVDSDGELMVLGGLEEFREHLGGQLAITLLKGIGQEFEAHSIDVPQIIHAIHELEARHVKRARKIIYAHA